jgi:sec-independent protein translocase protein TatA
MPSNKNAKSTREKAAELRAEQERLAARRRRTVVAISTVLIIALVVLGPKKLPEAGRSLGKGLREFKDSIAGNDSSKIEENFQADPSASLAQQVAAAQPVQQHPAANAAQPVIQHQADQQPHG